MTIHLCYRCKNFGPQGKDIAKRTQQVKEVLSENISGPIEK